MIIVGLSGGIATGKSTVAKILIDMKLPLIDGDIISREITVKGSKLLEDLKTAFGTSILFPDGSLNREALGSIIFNNTFAKEKLNSIIHPAIKEELLKRIAELKSKGEEILIVDGALVGEGIFTGFYNKLILVYTKVEIQIERLMKRNSLTYEEAIKRINSQLPFEEKKKIADYIIDNSYDIEYTKKQIKGIIDELIALEEFNV